MLCALALFIACGSNVALAQTDSTATVSKVLIVEKKWNDVYRRGDVAAMDALLADDFIITVEDGTTFSKTGFIARSGNPGLQVETSDMSDLQVRMHGNTAVVTGAYHEKGSDRGKRYEYRDRLTDVWMNRDGRWRLVASHYSVRE